MTETKASIVLFGSAARRVAGQPWPKDLLRNRPRDVDVAWVCDCAVTSEQAALFAEAAHKMATEWASAHGFGHFPVHVVRGLSVEEPVAECVDHGAIIHLGDVSG